MMLKTSPLYRSEGFRFVHIINTQVVIWRCKSERYSNKWSAGRERYKEISACQGSDSLRLLLEIFWKFHTIEGLGALPRSHFKLRSAGSQSKIEVWKILMQRWPQASVIFFFIYFFFLIFSLLLLPDRHSDMAMIPGMTELSEKKEKIASCLVTSYQSKGV